MSKFPFRPSLVRLGREKSDWQNTFLMQMLWILWEERVTLALAVRGDGDGGTIHQEHLPPARHRPLTGSGSCPGDITRAANSQHHWHKFLHKTFRIPNPVHRVPQSLIYNGDFRCPSKSYQMRDIVYYKGLTKTRVNGLSFSTASLIKSNHF